MGKEDLYIAQSPASCCKHFPASSPKSVCYWVQSTDKRHLLSSTFDITVCGHDWCRMGRTVRNSASIVLRIILVRSSFIWTIYSIDEKNYDFKKTGARIIKTQEINGHVTLSILQDTRGCHLHYSAFFSPSSTADCSANPSTGSSSTTAFLRLFRQPRHFLAASSSSSRWRSSSSASS